MSGNARKSFNLSLQKKRNQNVLAPIIEKCDNDGSYVADKVVDYVEKALEYERSVGLNKVANTYGLIKNTLSSQYTAGTPEFERQIEAVLRSVIRIDGERLAQFISDPNSYSGDATDVAPSEPRYQAPVQRVVETPAPQAAPVAVAPAPVVEAPPAPPVETPVEDSSDDEAERQAEIRRLEREAKRREREAERERALQEAEKASEPTEEKTEDEDDVEINEYALFNE